MPGATGTMLKVCGADAVPLRVTTTVAVPEPEGTTFQGIWAFTWPGETKYSPAGMLLNVTDTLLSDVESGMLSFCVRPEASSVPKIETSEPGATAWSLVKLAPFKTPPETIAGV